ncbi:type VI secretion system baseplate subunit TssE [Vibrio sp. SCSIO 43135]|uniref:Type VI secretion system baseplate subunit TssE n=1 Tax=Vibrio paucivorans TaxID=2829489 RepID=A0A9X3CDL5_9VIBR|nr:MULTISPECIES: type VI secretion system baseplate subunit TssE [Vibrio]MCW8333872.1 type VI secretion system baseplate subunit TssE [Vibrio paucivorans]USD43066.1 type VI secretion system baseplate subunit TssE [Vibrio sp. SCSIO 43135]
MTYLAPEESAFGVGFLERLEADAKPISLTRGPELGDVLDSIKRNVSNILNTRIGGAQSAPLLGLIDFNDATLDTMDLSLRIRIAIQSCLEVYEPRLAKIEVRSSSELGMNLKFQIFAELNCDALHQRVQLQLMLDQNRKYRVY